MVILRTDLEFGREVLICGRGAAGRVQGSQERVA